MRRGLATELRRLVSPLAWVTDRAFRWLPAWLALLTGAWLVSGVTVVEANEVALVLRFGALTGEGTAQAVHPPGLLFAPPKPIGEVVRVPVRTVFELELRHLHHEKGEGPYRRGVWSADPRRVGYALTGDRNVVHVAMVARYQISDPVAYAFAVEDPASVLSSVVVDEMARATGERPVDAVLTDGRSDLVDAVVASSQQRLDELGAGLALVSLELIDLAPPPQVKNEFAEVQSASIEAETAVQEAREYRAEALPRAASSSADVVSTARADAATRLSAARGEAQAFRVLAEEYAQHPVVVRERLYRERLEGPLKEAGTVRFLPPPVHGDYRGFRVSIP